MNIAVPHKLINRIQRYAWGRVGQDSLIHRLLGSSDTATLAAELWLGAHPSAPSEILGENGNTPIDTLLAKEPGRWLGKRAHERFGATLPYLFKVLSIRTALSIQAHPDRGLAVELHASDPGHYPDPNHKPEMAIAVSEVELLYGFRNVTEIRTFFQRYASLPDLLTAEVRSRLLSSALLEADQDLLRDLCFEIFHAPEPQLRKALMDVVGEIRKTSAPLPEERWLLGLADEYPGDVGLLCFFLLNYLVLNSGDAIFVGPNTPHAYLRGDLLECMANSDNVVRAGLTNKFKDVETLLKMLHFRSARPEVFGPVAMREDRNRFRFPTPAKEFQVELFNASSSESWVLKKDSAAILFCLEGKAKLNFGSASLPISRGDAYFFAAECQESTLSSESGTFYLISVP